MKIQMLVYPGMTLLDLVGPAQVWSMWPGVQTQYVWKEPGPVPTDTGLPVCATVSFADAWATPDILFAPGGMGGTFKLLDDSETIGFLATRGETAGWVASVCTGAHLLGAAGVLKGYRAATHWIALDELALFGATPSPGRFVIDRNRATGGGVTAGIDFGLALMAHVLGRDAAQIAQLALQYAPQPPFQAGEPQTAGADIVAETRLRFGGDRGAARIKETCTRAAARLA